MGGVAEPDVVERISEAFRGFHSAQ
jgi:hypothetical protein